MAEPVIIKRLGRRGDGIAVAGGREIYVPFTLPGEIVKLAGKGSRRELVSIKTASPNRIEPVCPHFGSCGGCQTQHFNTHTYDEWKTALVREALLRAGITTAIKPMSGFATASRRRAVFGARMAGGRLIFGFSGRGSHTLVPLETCAVLQPDIVEQIPVLARIAGALAHKNKPFRMSVLAADNGLDLTMHIPGSVSQHQRSTAIGLALEHEIARLCLEDEILIEMQRPSLEIAGLALTPPPGAFVQAVKQAEDRMAQLVSDHLSGCRHVADLFCGVGTFALHLARSSNVLAAETHAASLGALQQAWRATGGRLKPIDTQIRNLEQRPLMMAELKQIDGLVFDPPRSGAELQTRQIAGSAVKKIAAVSCNPVTLARDLAILVEGGYQVMQITPLDQFKFTPHVEVVALLEKA